MLHFSTGISLNNVSFWNGSNCALKNDIRMQIYEDSVESYHTVSLEVQQRLQSWGWSKSVVALQDALNKHDDHWEIGVFILGCTIGLCVVRKETFLIMYQNLWCLNAWLVWFSYMRFLLLTFSSFFFFLFCYLIDHTVLEIYTTYSTT